MGSLMGTYVALAFREFHSSTKIIIGNVHQNNQNNLSARKCEC